MQRRPPNLNLNFALSPIPESEGHGPGFESRSPDHRRNQSDITEVNTALPRPHSRTLKIVANQIQTKQQTQSHFSSIFAPPPRPRSRSDLPEKSPIDPAEGIASVSPASTPQRTRSSTLISESPLRDLTRSAFRGQDGLLESPQRAGKQHLGELWQTIPNKSEPAYDMDNKEHSPSIPWTGEDKDALADSPVSNASGVTINSLVRNKVEDAPHLGHAMNRLTASANGVLSSSFAAATLKSSANVSPAGLVDTGEPDPFQSQRIDAQQSDKPGRFPNPDATPFTYNKPAGDDSKDSTASQQHADDAAAPRAPVPGNMYPFPPGYLQRFGIQPAMASDPAGSAFSNSHAADRTSIYQPQDPNALNFANLSFQSQEQTRSLPPASNLQRQMAHARLAVSPHDAIGRDAGVPAFEPRVRGASLSGFSGVPTGPAAESSTIAGPRLFGRAQASTAAGPSSGGFSQTPTVAGPSSAGYSQTPTVAGSSSASQLPMPDMGHQSLAREFAEQIKTGFGGLSRTGSHGSRNSSGSRGSRRAVQSPAPRASGLAAPPNMLIGDPFVARLKEKGGPTFNEALHNVPFCDLTTNITPLNPGVVKITEIPYSATRKEIAAIFGRHSEFVRYPQQQPHQKAAFEAVHIIMERATGKSMDAYAEFKNVEAARFAIERFVLNRTGIVRSARVGDRVVGLQLAPAQEMMKAIFPRAKCVEWTLNGVKILPAVTEGYRSSGFTGFLHPEELLSLTRFSQEPHRSKYTISNPQRAFESMISILVKYPWERTDVITINERDSIYTALFHMIEALVTRHIPLQREMSLGPFLLEELVLLGHTCPGFTDRQRARIADVAYPTLGMPPTPLTVLAGEWPFLRLSKHPNCSDEYATVCVAKIPCLSERTLTCFAVLCGNPEAGVLL